MLCIHPSINTIAPEKKIPSLFFLQMSNQGLGEAARLEPPWEEDREETSTCLRRPESLYTPSSQREIFHVFPPGPEELGGYSIPPIAFEMFL